METDSTNKGIVESEVTKEEARWNYKFDIVAVVIGLVIVAYVTRPFVDEYKFIDTLLAVIIIGLPAYRYRLYRYEKQEKTLFELAMYRTSGVELRNDAKDIKYTDAGFKDWETKYKKWKKDVIDKANEFSPVVSERLKTLDTMDLVTYEGIKNPVYVGHISYLSETLKRIDRILETRFRPTHAP